MSELTELTFLAIAALKYLGRGRKKSKLERLKYTSIAADGHVLISSGLQ